MMDPIGNEQTETKPPGIVRTPGSKGNTEPTKTRQALSAVAKTGERLKIRSAAFWALLAA